MFIDSSVDFTKYTVGGKAMGLYKLKALGLNVPEFRVLPFESIRVRSEVELDEFELSDDTYQQLLDLLNSWEAHLYGVSVRSSVADEDGAKNAFSGIMKTFVNQRTIEDVVHSIKECIRSAFSAQAIQYREMNGLTLDIKTAVIIQRQVHSDCSGVMFTTNPRYPQELAIHCVYGQGEGLVSGALNPDEYYILKHNGELYRKNIEEKKTQLALDLKGTVLLPIPEEIQSKALLDQELIGQLYQKGRMLEDKFNHPQDVEFAIVGRTIWFLQSRAITQKIEPLMVFDNSNIQESYSGVVSPLTFSFAQRAYATVYMQTMRSLQLPESTILAYKETVENLLGLYKGRVYYNINNWYKGLQLLPSFKQNKADMERMMGLKEPVDFVQSSEKSLFEKIKMIPSLLLNIFKLLIAFIKLDKSIIDFLQYFSNYHSSFYARIKTVDSIEKCWEEKKMLDKHLLHNWSVPIVNDFYVMMQNGKVHRRLRKQGIENPDLYISKFKFGLNGIASYKQGIALERLARQISQVPNLKQLILDSEEHVDLLIEKEHPSIYRLITVFIEEYGDRTIGELKLETITMRQNRSIFYKYLRIYLDEKHSPFNMEEDEKERIPPSIRKLLIAIKNRESLRLKRTHLFGMYRSVYLNIGFHLEQHGRIETSRDIFYLKEEEVEAYIYKPESLNLKEIIQSRKVEWEEYLNKEVPDRVLFPMPPGIRKSETEQGVEELLGEPCAGNTVRGEAILVDNANEDLLISGKIIIAKRTDPGWIALFPSALGVIIEKGSSLSHSVILLREMNKPSIINVPFLMKSVKNGDIIEMNPMTGEIKFIK